MNTDYMAAQWSLIDETSAPERFIRYLDFVSGHSTIRTIKDRTYRLLRIAQGAQILDIGCGLGDDALAMAAQVGPSGRVVGVDRSEAILTEARRRLVQTSLPVILEQGNAEALHFADDSFDGCRAERVLVHLNSPEAAIAEMVRVSRPGARIVAFDLDWETLVVDASNRVSLTLRIARSRECF